MINTPECLLRIYEGQDEMPEDLRFSFENERELSIKPLPKDRVDPEHWNSFFVCAETSAKEVIGGVCIDVGPLNYGSMQHGKMGFLEYVFVHADHRGKGIGEKLIRRAMEEARNRRCQFIRCEADLSNAAEMALYRKCGFALAETGQGSECLAVKPLNT
ncbi:GNAT family N-acetyltransferase [Candidatus Sumerlaeota bacterium]|nr:GNAT family N-acetyltransferase [Candidatus Sumerlaeota bacterium]